MRSAVPGALFGEAECFGSCNRANENQRIYNRLHPLSKVEAITEASHS